MPKNISTIAQSVSAIGQRLGPRVIFKDSGCPAHPGEFCANWEEIQLVADEDA